MSRDIYAETTDRVIAALESGTVPWRKPWTDAGPDRPLATGKPYRGINVFLTALTRLERGYDSPLWVTFKQAKKLGGRVRAGERGTMLVWWSRVRVKDRESNDPDAKRTISLLRHFTVFNVEQVDGLESKLPTEEEREEFVASETAEEILAGYVGNFTQADSTGPAFIENGSPRAYYAPSLDEIHMPKRESFESREAFYSTAFHEAVHSTGHEKRLAREDLGKDSFGSEPYSREELTAELGAAMLAGVCGLASEEQVAQSGAYLRSWIRALENDRKLLVTAAARAQRAADMIRGMEWEGNGDD